MITRQEPTAAVLANLYNAIRQSVTEPTAYYSAEEITELKNNPKNIFFERKEKPKT